MLNKNIPITVLVLLLAISLFQLLGCSATSTGPGGVGTAVIQSNSLITGEIKAIRSQSTGYPWEIDVLVQSSTNVDDLPNPTADKVGKVVTARADQDLSSFHMGQKISANVKYTGDVPRPGIILYIYNIKPI